MCIILWWCFTHRCELCSSLKSHTHSHFLIFIQLIDFREKWWIWAKVRTRCQRILSNSVYHCIGFFFHFFSHSSHASSPPAIPSTGFHSFPLLLIAFTKYKKGTRVDVHTIPLFYRLTHRIYLINEEWMLLICGICENWIFPRFCRWCCWCCCCCRWRWCFVHAFSLQSILPPMT